MISLFSWTLIFVKNGDPCFYLLKVITLEHVEQLPTVRLKKHGNTYKVQCTRFRYRQKTSSQTLAAAAHTAKPIKARNQSHSNVERNLI